jgi:putative ABC transport system permease protein
MMLASLWNDLRHAARLLLRAPGFTAIAVGALAIGIGANTATFSVANSLLLRELPYANPERLAVIWEHNLPRDRKNNVVSPGNFIHWREMQQTFEDLAAVGMTFTVTLTGDGEPEELPMQMVSASFFPVLGVQPAIGRTFRPEDDRPNSRAAVISDRLWKRRFGGNAHILDRPITIGGSPYAVLGVMPPGFSFLDKTVEVWLPTAFTAAARTPRGRWINVVGRMKPGVSLDQAQRDMARVHGELARLFPDFNTGWTARVVLLERQLTGDVRPALFVLLGAVAFVLLIACANVANLLLARATARQRELAVRAALGAGRGRLVRQLLAESALLAATGGAAGLLLAWWAVNLLRAVVAERLPIQRLESVSIDGEVLAFTIAVSVASGLLFGLVPALSASGGALAAALKDGARAGSGARAARARSMFVIVQVALALVLLAGAGLLIRSFVSLLNVDAGFESGHTVTMRVSLPGSRYAEPASRVRFFDRLFDRIDVLPGIAASGATSFLPLTGLGAATSYAVIGEPKPPAGNEPVCDVRVVASRYFQAMGVPLLAGRLFDDHDKGDQTNRIIVNETMARRHWPNGDALGKRVRISWNDPREDEIVGIVGNVRHQGLETEPRSMIYWPYPRFPYPGMTLAFRTSGDPRSIVNAAVALIREQDPDLAVARIRTMGEVVADSVAQRRLTMQLIVAFALAALVLAAVGIYGVIAYAVTQRTQEIGIRMALGAQRGDVVRMIVGHALLLAVAGVAIGLAGAFTLTGLMKELLFDVRPDDPLTFGVVAIGLTLVALAASYLPGRRATRVDPVVALRAE